MSIYLFLLLVALLGHFAFWNAAANRIHSTALPHWTIHIISTFYRVIMFLTPVMVCWWFLQRGSLLIHQNNLAIVHWLAIVYLAFCWIIFLGPFSRWLTSAILRHQSGALIHNKTEIVDMRSSLDSLPLGTLKGRLFERIPGNQILQLQVHHKTLKIPNLPPELDGLTIAHLSDLHMTGDLSCEFFEEVVRQTNDFQADIIAITGDMFDNRNCFQWIEKTFARLRSNHGTYFILGNHEVKIGAEREVRQRLQHHGLVDLGSRWLEVAVRDTQILLAGNESPWITPAADMDLYDSSNPQSNLYRILLSHAPDQIHWAQHHRFDLMLAGHTHGGQIRLPLLGPIFAPSRLGLRYASGTFDQPPTILHVSRGISGKTPLRLNCPPELVKLTLICGDEENQC